MAKSAGEGLFPVARDGVEAVEMPLVTMRSVAGADASVAGMDLPVAGRSETAGDVAVLWYGRAHWMVLGEAEVTGAVTDQSDAWCRVALEGARAREVLEYLTPVDLREPAFPVGAVARTQIAHMSGLIWRDGTARYQVMVFRSMAATLAHDLKGAMQSLP